MSRTLYRWLLWLHPPAFRREFAGEMLWIFEEASAEGVVPLFTDGVISLLRQWLLRMGPWKIAVALIGAFVEVFAGGLGGLIFWDAQIREHLAKLPLQPPPTPAQTASMDIAIHVGMWAVTGVLLMVVFLVLWVKSFNDRRLVRLAAVSRR